MLVIFVRKRRKSILEIKYEVGDLIHSIKDDLIYRIIGHGYGEGTDYVYHCRLWGMEHDPYWDKYFMATEFTAYDVPEKVEVPDMVNHPPHYNNGKVECIDAMESATVNKKGIEAVCTANVIKYLWRYETKNGIEDVKKAKWYLDKLLTKLESEGE
jgi:hypothetical protein